MAIFKPNYSGVGGNLQNPLADLGSTLTQQAQAQREFDQRQAQQQVQNELAREANQRAADQLQMQKDEVARQQAARDASSQYLAGLGQAMDKGVVSLADQGRLAAISQDARLTPEQKQQQIDALLPKMSDAYQKDTNAQLQLLRNVTAPSALDTRDKIALLGTATAPLEQIAAQDRDYAFKQALETTRNANEQALLGARLAGEAKMYEARTKAEIEADKKKFENKRDQTFLYDPSDTKTKKLYADATPAERSTWLTGDDLTRLFNTGKYHFDTKQKQDDYISTTIGTSGNSKDAAARIAQLDALGVPKLDQVHLLQQSEKGGYLDFGKPDIDLSILDAAIAAKKAGTYVPPPDATKAESRVDPLQSLPGESDSETLRRITSIPGTSKEKDALIQKLSKNVPGAEYKTDETAKELATLEKDLSANYAKYDNATRNEKMQEMQKLREIMNTGVYLPKSVPAHDPLQGINLF